MLTQTWKLCNVCQQEVTASPTKFASLKNMLLTYGFKRRGQPFDNFHDCKNSIFTLEDTTLANSKRFKYGKFYFNLSTSIKNTYCVQFSPLGSIRFQDCSEFFREVWAFFPWVYKCCFRTKSIFVPAGNRDWTVKFPTFYFLLYLMCNNLYCKV